MVTVRKREVGGALPSVPALWQETLQDVVEHIQGYLQVGLALLVVAVPLGFILTFVGLFVLYGGMFIGGFASVGIGEAVGQATDSRDLGGLIAAVGGLGSFFCAFLGFFGIIMLGSAVTAPLSASLVRAIAAHQRGEGELTFQSAFSTIRQDAIATMIGLACVVVCSLIGVLFCYVGALVPAMLFAFVLPLIAVGRLGAMAALRRSAQTAMAKPGEHAIYALAHMGTALICAYIPVIGYAFMLALQVRAYRKLYGDAELTGV